MRFNKSFRYEKIRINGPLVEEAFTAGRQRADTDHIFINTALMDDDVFPIGNFGTVFID